MMINSECIESYKGRQVVGCFLINGNYRVGGRWALALNG